jgi:hypothetical protein
MMRQELTNTLAGRLQVSMGSQQAAAGSRQNTTREAVQMLEWLRVDARPIRRFRRSIYL